MFAIAAALVSVCDTPSISAEEGTATLSVVNPRIELSGVKIKEIAATLDGREIGGCDADRPRLSNTCIKATAIHSGPHVLEVTLDPGTDASDAAKSVTVTVKFTAGLSGKWVLDVKGLAVPNGRESDYLGEHPPRAPAEGCLAALDRVTRISSCSRAGVEALAPALEQASHACGGAAGKGAAVERALTEIGEDHFELTVDQCYTAAERELLPDRLVVASGDRNTPGENGLTTSSWSWAREVFAGPLPEPPEAAAVLEKVRGVIPEMAARVAVVDGVAAAYLSDDPSAVMQAAEREGWSLDPTTPAGQRDILLLRDPRRFSDRAYSDFIAANAAADDKLNCDGTPWKTRLLVNYFMFLDGNFSASDELSPAGWKAILAMAERVPPDGDFGACYAVFFDSKPRIKSPVSDAERLHRFFEIDCGAARSPERRGQTLVQFLRDNWSEAPILKEQVRTNFAACLAGAEQAAAAAGRRP